MRHCSTNLVGTDPKLAGQLGDGPVAFDRSQSDLHFEGCTELAWFGHLTTAMASPPTARALAYALPPSLTAVAVALASPPLATHDGVHGGGGGGQGRGYGGHGGGHGGQ